MTRPSSFGRPELSVVVPAFNEIESLFATIESIRKAAVDVPTLEIVLVNDGSTDGTLGLMNILAMEHPEQIVVVDRQTNGGMGRALADGCARATGRLVTWIPGDGEYDLAEVLEALPSLAERDVILARRTKRGSRGRNVLSSGMYVLTNALFRFDARKYCGIFLIERETLRRLRVASKDVCFSLEVAIRACRSGLTIGYTNVEWQPRRAGRSKVFNARTVLRNLVELFKLRLTLWREG